MAEEATAAEAYHPHAPPTQRRREDDEVKR